MIFLDILYVLVGRPLLIILIVKVKYVINIIKIDSRCDIEFWGLIIKSLINELMSLKPRVNVVKRRMLLSPFCFIIRTFTQNGLRPTFSILDYLQRYICYVVAPTITPSRFALKSVWCSLYRSWGTKTLLFLYNFYIKPQLITQRCPKWEICLLSFYKRGLNFCHRMKLLPL